MIIDQYISNKQRLLNYCLKLTGNRQDANDLLQESMVNLLESNYEEKGKFITYAFQVIKHNFMNEVRRKNHIRARIEENPEIYYNERDVEKERELHRAIRKLQSQRVKECLIVRLMGMENQEAAKILNLNPSTVRGAWARGIKQLRQMKALLILILILITNAGNSQETIESFLTIEPPNQRIQRKIEHRYEKAVINIDFYEGRYTEIDEDDLTDYYEVWLFKLPIIPKRWHKYVFKYDLITINENYLTSPDEQPIMMKTNHK